MATIHPFPAYVPPHRLAATVSSVPYDVITRAEAKAIGSNHPESFLHVIRPDIDLPDDVDEHDGRVYESAARTFERFVDDGVLVRDPRPALYVYRLSAAGHVQTGIVGCCDVGDYESGVMKRHELTRPDKEDDRVRHIRTVGAHTGPVLTVYRDTSVVRDLVDRVVAGPPLFEFTSRDGVAHAGWRVDAPERLVAAFSDIESLYIADGHHRAAAASRVAAALPGNREASRFLCVLFPHTELKILPYNRYLAVDGDVLEAAVAAVEERHEVRSVDEGVPAAPHELRFYAAGRWRGIRLDIGEQAGPVDRLDLAVFDRTILEPHFGITDQRRDPRIEFVGGVDAVAELERRVDAGGGIAFSFPPVSIDELIAVSDAGEMMPPKSTWFSPKLRSGLFIHRFS